MLFRSAFIGVSSVLAVYAWADSLPDYLCRERLLNILLLWHGVNGYREVRWMPVSSSPSIDKYNFYLDPESFAPSEPNDLSPGMHAGGQ